MVRKPPRQEGRRKRSNIAQERETKESRQKLELEFAEIARETRKANQTAVEDLDMSAAPGDENECYTSILAEHFNDQETPPSI
jgi:hypothetical protein